MCMRVPQKRYKIPEYFNDNDWHIVNLQSELPLTRTNPLSVAEADLNSEWILAGGTSEESSIISQAGSGYIVVKSNSNYHVNNSTATMYVYFASSYGGNFTFKIMNRAESNYDYPTVTLENGTVLYNNKANTTSFTSFTVPAGEHTMTVTFIKDSSQNSDLDRAFLAMPEDVSIL